jgi:mRNA-degrading endonuclease RelE of RelBE toxin-antitoxin system
MFSVLVSATFKRQLEHCDSDVRKRIVSVLHLLESDPITPRSGADIKPLSGTHPLKYRIRTGDYRVIYTIDGQDIRVIELFRRERGYR